MVVDSITDHFTIETLFGVIAGVIIPTILFFWRLHYVSKRTHDMHLEPDKFGFGTAKTNELLIRHMDEEVTMHRESILATRELRDTIAELTHYVRWLHKSTNGKSAPPYVRSGS